MPAKFPGLCFMLVFYSHNEEVDRKHATKVTGLSDENSKQLVKVKTVKMLKKFLNVTSLPEGLFHI